MSKAKQLLETCCPEEVPVSPREPTDSEIDINELKNNVQNDLNNLIGVVNQLSHSVRKLYDGITEELEKV